MIKRLTVVASLLLVPTFIVGVYGRTSPHPGDNDVSAAGAMWVWLLIIVSTLGQLWYFRRRKWL